MIELMPHQERAVAWLQEHPRTALFMDVGLGKTFPAIAAAQRPILVICPRYLRYMWQDALWAMGVRAQVVEGTADQRYSMLLQRNGYDAQIINYQMLTLGPASSITTAKYAPLYIGAWGTVIADEAHYFRGRNSWWKGAKKLRTDAFYMLTATPHMTNWGDVWPILNLIDKREFSSYHHFVDTHLQTFLTTFNKDIGAPRDPQAFGALLDQYALRMTYEEAGRKRPEHVEHDLPVPLTDKTLSEMKEVRKTLWYWSDPQEHGLGKEPVPNKGALAHVLRHIVARDDNKLDMLSEVVDAHEEPIIIWTWYVETADALIAHLAKNPKNLLTLYEVHGRLSDRTRKDNVEAFKRHGGILVANLAALSEGENLQNCAVQVFYEASHVGTTNHQAIGRSARTGQDRIVQVYNLVGRRSPDERVLRVARNRLQAGRDPWEYIADDDE